MIKRNIKMKINPNEIFNNLAMEVLEQVGLSDKN